jgi:oligopeptide/dipeptide ABC transporter ATP-binding protein
MLLEVCNLSVEFGPVTRPVRAVADVDLTIGTGEIVGIAGESGSGKTTLCAALLRALPKTARVSGDIRFDSRSINALSPEELRQVRGREIAMILQNPMTSLDPLFTIGNQLREVLATRCDVPASRLHEREIELLRSVHMTAPAERLRQYPHELSGGMRQRVLIAMAGSTAPKLLLADEPTTALDATIQEEILVLFRELRDRRGTAIAIVTHDLGVIRRICDRIVIMYAGRIVEEGPVGAVFTAPRHPYTKALLASVPVLDEDRVHVQSIAGQVPNLADLGDFCAFADRCSFAVDQCRASAPRETALGDRQRVFCWRAKEIS